MSRLPKSRLLQSRKLTNLEASKKADAEARKAHIKAEKDAAAAKQAAEQAAKTQAAVDEKADTKAKKRADVDKAKADNVMTLYKQTERQASAEKKAADTKAKEGNNCWPTVDEEDLWVPQNLFRLRTRTDKFN